MRKEFVIDAISKITGVDCELLLGTDRSAKVRHIRHMMYLILRERCGVSSYKLARIFHRTRRNILRSMSNIRCHISIYEEVKNEYDDLISKIESAERVAFSILKKDEKDKKD